MESISGEEILQSKCAVERVAAAHGVCVKWYHLDNARFGEKAFRAACDEQEVYCNKYDVDEDGILPEEKFFN
eukprot:15357570-Ditylum_brightwellii.AAC.1